MYNKLSSFQNLYYYIIIFRSVWKCTICAYLDFFAILLYVGLTSGTVWHTIHRTITKQTIKFIRKSLVTRKIFAIFVFKVFIRVFHFYSFYIHMLFSQSSLQNADLTDNTGAEIQASNYHGLSRSRSFCLWPAWSQYNRLRYRCCRNNEIHAPLFFHLAVENCYAFPQAQYIRT